MIAIFLTRELNLNKILKRKNTKCLRVTSTVAKDAAMTQHKNVFPAKSQWLILGSTHFMGRALAKKAQSEGLVPVLADNSISRLRHFAQKLDLPWCLVSYDEKASLVKAFSKVAVVINCYTSSVRKTQACVEACIQAGVHYIDGCQDYRLLSVLYHYHDEALKKNIIVMSSCGLASVTEAMARLMVKQSLMFDEKKEEKHTFVNRIVPFKFLVAIEGFDPKNIIHLGSILNMGLPTGIEWRKGALKKLKISKRIRNITLRNEKKTGIVFPLPEIISLPRRLPVESIRTLIIQPRLYAGCFAFMGWLNEKVTKRKSLLGFFQKGAVPLSKYLRTKIVQLDKERLYIWIKGKQGELDLPMVGIETEGLYPLILDAQIRALKAIPSVTVRGVVSMVDGLGERAVLQGD